MNQFIILKTDTRKAQPVPLVNQRAKENFLFKEVLQLIKKDGIIDYYSSNLPVNDADTDHPRPLTSQKEKTNFKCLLKEQNTT